MKIENILFLMEGEIDPYHGGVQKIVYKLGQYFFDQGFNVFVISTFADVHSVIELPFGKGIILPQNINPEKISQTALQYRPQIVINEMPYVLDFQKALILMKEEIIFISYGCLNNSLYSVKNNLPAYIKEVCGFYPKNKILQLILKKLLLLLHRAKHAYDLKRILKNHDYFVLPSSAHESLSELNYFIPNYNPERVIGIDNSVEMPLVSIKFNDKKKYLLYVGRINVHQKRSDLLPLIWNAIKEKLPDWEFHIIGDGEYKKFLNENFINEERVTLHGFKNPNEYYFYSSIFINPTAFEGFPSTLIEAQSFGVIPIAFNNYPVLPYILDYGNAGMPIDAFNLELFCESIINLANDENLLRFYFNNVTLNANKFSIITVGNKWIRTFEFHNRSHN